MFDLIKLQENASFNFQLKYSQGCEVISLDDFYSRPVLVYYLNFGADKFSWLNLPHLYQHYHRQ